MFEVGCVLPPTALCGSYLHPVSAVRHVDGTPEHAQELLVQGSYSISIFLFGNKIQALESVLCFSVAAEVGQCELLVYVQLNTNIKPPYCSGLIFVFGEVLPTDAVFPGLEQRSVFISNPNLGSSALLRF